MTDLLTISQVARRSGVSASALRFYETRSLITSQRSGAAHRRYPRAILRRVAFIVFAQRVGLSLDEIGEQLARLPETSGPERADWAVLSRLWVGRIDERIAELQRLRAGLAQCIGCGCLSIAACRYANPGDRAALRGPGPRYWLGDRQTGRRE